MSPPRLLLGALIALDPPAVAAQPADANPAACPDSASLLLILGTYHMANPGLDAYNVDADDVRSPRRQAEIAELIERLAAFEPTVIAIEAAHDDDTWPERYARYLRGDYELGRSEIDQIAFRLARHLGHEAVQPVDYPMWMNGWRPDEIDWDRVRARNAARDSAKADRTASPPDPEQRRLLESTVVEYLAWLNSDDSVRRNHEAYLRMLLPSDGIGIYSRTDEVANWYERNLRIFTNLIRVTRHGTDRVLLVIGAGHVRILRDLAAAAPYFCPVPTSTYLTAR